MSRETIEWLNTNTRIGFTDQRGKAWHYRAGSTNHFPGPVPKDEVMGLFAWDPVVLPHTYEWDGEIRHTDRINVVRGDTGCLLGVFKQGYQPHPYREWLVEKVEHLLDDGLAIGSAGLLRNGAVAWGQVELPETVDVPEIGERFRPTLLVTTSLDGSVATTYREVVTRVVCDNTLGAAIGERGRVVRVKHTSGSAGRLNIVTARDVLGIIFKTADEVTTAMTELYSQTVTDKQWQRFLDIHMGERPTEPGRSQTMYDTKREKLRQLWRTDERVAPWSGTAWGVLNAVNTYKHHEAIVRGTVPAFRNMENTIKGEFDKLDALTLHQLELAMA